VSQLFTVRGPGLEQNDIHTAWTDSLLYQTLQNKHFVHRIIYTHVIQNHRAQYLNQLLTWDKHNSA